MKVSVEQFLNAISILPKAESNCNFTQEIDVPYLSDLGESNPEYIIRLVFTKNKERNGWNMFMPTRHTNPTLDDPANQPS